MESPKAPNPLPVNVPQHNLVGLSNEGRMWNSHGTKSVEMFMRGPKNFHHLCTNHWISNPFEVS